MAACKSCGASILWAKTDTGKSMPVDAEPTDDGNVLLYRTPRGLQAVVMGARTEPDPRASRHHTHFETCPQAQEHRRNR